MIFLASISTDYWSFAEKLAFKQKNQRKIFRDCWTDKDDCRFNIEVKYDFEKSVWVKGDQTKINDMRWSTAHNMYPRKNNALRVVVGTSSNQEYNQPFYIPFTDNQVSGSSEDFGLFFCSDDKITLEAVKAGAINQSRLLCEKLWTPMLCQNRTLDSQLVTLADNLQSILKSENQTVDWKQSYHSATSRITGTFRY